MGGSTAQLPLRTGRLISPAVGNAACWWLRWFPPPKGAASWRVPPSPRAACTYPTISLGTKGPGVKSLAPLHLFWPEGHTCSQVPMAWTETCGNCITAQLLHRPHFLTGVSANTAPSKPATCKFPLQSRPSGEAGKGEAMFCENFSKTLQLPVLSEDTEKHVGASKSHAIQLTWMHWVCFLHRIIQRQRQCAD